MGLCSMMERLVTLSIRILLSNSLLLELSPLSTPCACLSRHQPGILRHLKPACIMALLTVITLCLLVYAALE